MSQAASKCRPATVMELDYNMPALVVSSYAEAEGVAPDLPRLTKPFRQADLAASVAELCREH